MLEMDMKVVILAGGHGTRLAEETVIKPKPMIEIGGKPIIWHIMRIYAAHGFADFIVACGYKGEILKEYLVAVVSRLDEQRVRSTDLQDLRDLAR